MPWRARWGDFVSNLLCFRSRTDKVPSQTSLDHTIAQKSDHNSGLKRDKRKFERCGPAYIIVELEWTLYTVS